MTTENNSSFILSSDVSWRFSPLRDLKLMLECIFSGKKFTTDILHELPTQHIPQLLGEMNVGDTDEMLLLSSSEEFSPLFTV